MSRKLILHIGTGKTGSSTIQYLLSQSRPALLEQGVCYPGKLGNHLPMAMQFSSVTSFYDNFDARVWHAKDPQVLMAEQQESFEREINSLPAHIDRVILSCEQFSQLIRTPQDIGRFHAMLAPFFDDMEVLVYLRRQDGHYASMYSQDLRRGMVRRPRLSAGREDIDIYNYEKLLDQWASAFGADRIKARIFERDTDKSYDVVTDFMAQTGIKTLPTPKDAAPRNPSMNAAGQRMLREIGKSLKAENGNDLASATLWKRLHHAVTMALPGSGWRPTQEEGRAFVATFAASNEAVRKKWFPERAALFSADFSHLPVEEMRPDKRAETRAAYDVILYLLQQEMTRDADVSKRKAEISKGAEKRRAALVASVQLEPKNISARVDLAEFQAGEGAIKAARHNLRKALKLAPDNTRAREILESLPAE